MGTAYGMAYILGSYKRTFRTMNGTDKLLLAGFALACVPLVWGFWEDGGSAAGLNREK